MKILAYLLLLIPLNLNAQWVKKNVSPDFIILNSVTFKNSSSGITTGWQMNSPIITSGRGFYTNNNANTWTPATLPNACRVIVSTQYIDANTIYGVGAINLAALNSGNFSKKDFEATGQIKPSSLKNSGYTVDIYRGAFFKSTDAGASWQEFGTLPADCKYLTFFHFLDANTGIAATDLGSPSTNRGNIYKTTNGGQSWASLLDSSVRGQIESVQLINSNLFFATGYDFVNNTNLAVFLKSTNGGINWVRQESSTYGFKKVFFINENTGFIAGNQEIKGVVFKTTNQGTNWNLIYSSDSTSMLEIKFFEQTGTGIIVGNKHSENDTVPALAFRTSNFGENWSSQRITTSSYFITNVTMLDKYNYYAAGVYDSGELYYTNNGGSIGVNNHSQNLSDYSLSQNFPNPFNPSTIIKFYLPQKAQVVIKVYDINGKEVSELLNQVKQQGSHEVKFNAGDLSGGIYYYRITSGDFSETRKMILIK